MTDKKFAKSVAKELDRRRMRRRMFVWTAILGLMVAAVMFLRCGTGWGTGGKGPGSGGTNTASAVDPKAKRCSIRLSATGITVNGKRATREQAIATCMKTSGADVLITGDSRQGDWDALRAGLETANVPFFTREPRGVTPEPKDKK